VECVWKNCKVSVSYPTVSVGRIFSAHIAGVICTIMTLKSIRYESGKLEILDQLSLPAHSQYIEVKGVEDGWRAIHKMHVSRMNAFQIT
jgi:hypothetical protein